MDKHGFSGMDIYEWEEYTMKDFLREILEVWSYSRLKLREQLDDKGSRFPQLFTNF